MNASSPFARGKDLLMAANSVPPNAPVTGVVFVARVCLVLLFLCVPQLGAEIIWSDPSARVIHKTPQGSDLLGGVLRRYDKANDALYFRFRINPLSDVASEPYSAGIVLFEKNEARLGVGNAPEAWGYSAFNTAETSTLTGAKGEFDLKSANREAAGMGEFKPYELPRQNRERTIVFKVQFVPNGDDLITVWLDPDLRVGATEEGQQELLTSIFKADASFDQLRLVHEGGGNGWIFSDMAIANTFNDFIVVRFWQTWWFITASAASLLLLVGLGVRLIEKRKYQRQLERAEWERMVERERARIAQDLHDELGSSLARISLLSNLIRLDKDKPESVEAHSQKLAHSADQTVRALEEIVWAVRSGSDSLQGLMDYIAHFANEISEDTASRCRLDLPPDLPDRLLPPDYRHNVYLIVKEAITNAIKHSGATELRVRAQVEGETLSIEVSDNGRGFDPSSAAQGGDKDGLRNMRHRAESIQASLDVASQPGRGATVCLRSVFPDVSKK
jgi:signal transduction histidine kinase